MGLLNGKVEYTEGEGQANELAYVMSSPLFYQKRIQSYYINEGLPNTKSRSKVLACPLRYSYEHP